MARTPSSTAGIAPKTRSQKSKAADSKNKQLNTPPPEPDTTDARQAPSGNKDGETPTGKPEETSSQSSNRAEPPTLEALSVTAPGSPAPHVEGEANDQGNDQELEDNSDHGSDDERIYDDIYSGESTEAADLKGRCLPSRDGFTFSQILITL